MPQASDELRAEMINRFGTIDDVPSTQFLEERGWILGRDWTWSKPGLVLKDALMEEISCISFLIDEWDYGGIRE